MFLGCWGPPGQDRRVLPISVVGVRSQHGEQGTGARMGDGVLWSHGVRVGKLRHVPRPHIRLRVGGFLSLASRSPGVGWSLAPPAKHAGPLPGSGSPADPQHPPPVDVPGAHPSAGP